MNAVRRPTLAHVAKAANVSITTASASLRGTGRVNDETRLHVQSVARKLGYRTNSGASSLREGAGQLVGLVLESAAFDADPLNPKLFWPRFLNGFAGELNAAGIGVVLVSRDNLAPMAKAPMDAVVVLADLVADLAESLPFGMPIIGGSDPSADAVATVGHDYPTIVAQCIRHLKEEGARRIALLVPQSAIRTMDAIYALLASEAETQGLQTVVATSSADSVYEAVSAGADAVVTVGENLSGIIAVIEANGWSIPGDVLLFSLSEADFTEALVPAVSTMWFMGYESGRVAAEVARRGLIEGRFESATLPFELKKRASTARRT